MPLSSIKRARALRVQAEKDNLTGLGNRFKLLQDIKKAHKPFLALFDIVRFGEINDFYGYKIGDKLIVSFAQKLFCGADDAQHWFLFLT